MKAYSLDLLKRVLAMYDVGPPGACELDGPQGIAIGPNGNVYVASYFNDSVLEFSGVDGSPASPCVLFAGCPFVYPTYVAFAVPCATDADCYNDRPYDGAEKCLAGTCHRGLFRHYFEDFAGFQVCFSGPFAEAGFVLPGQNCLRAYDADHDYDVDNDDFATFYLILIAPSR